MRTLTLIITGLLLISSGQTQAESAENTITAEHHILPGYQQLSTNTKRLKQTADKFCNTPDNTEFKQLKTDYILAMQNWQSIQHIRFGPVEYLLRYHRFQLWPDKRGSVGKHLRKLLASEDEIILQPDQFPQASVAVQGFSALERVLYASGNNENPELSTYDCKLIIAITNNLDKMAVDIIDDWTQPPANYLQGIITAKDGNDLFDSEQEVSAFLLKSFHTELQFIVNQKLMRPLGETLVTARGKRAESWHSNQSLPHIHLNLRALEDLYDKAFLPRIKEQNLKQAITAAFHSSYSAIDAITLPLQDAVVDQQQRERVEALRNVISKLKSLVALQLTKELDIQLGFNSLDGD